MRLGPSRSSIRHVPSPGPATACVLLRCLWERTPVARQLPGSRDNCVLCSVFFQGLHTGGLEGCRGPMTASFLYRCSREDILVARKAPRSPHDCLCSMQVFEGGNPTGQAGSLGLIAPTSVLSVALCHLPVSEGVHLGGCGIPLCLVPTVFPVQVSLCRRSLRRRSLCRCLLETILLAGKPSWVS